MSSNTRSIAVLGYGTLGKPITGALLKAGATVVVFSRNASRLDLPAGASGASVSYTDEDSLVTALKEHSVEVVVSTLNEFGDTQLAVARAAKTAGAVKLFLPSEFGAPTNANKRGEWATKDAIAQTISKDIGIPTVRIYTGLWMEFFPWLVESPAHPGKVAISGKGQQKFSTTAISDIASFVAHILTALPYEKLENTVLRIQGQAVSLQEYAQIMGKEVAYVQGFELGPVKDVQQSDLVTSESRAQLQEVIEFGGLSTGYEHSDPSASADVVAQRAGSGNALWKGHTFKQLAT